MSLPPLPRSFPKVACVTGKSVDRRRLRLGRLRQPPHGHDQHATAGVRLVAVEHGVLRVVEAHDERPDSCLHDRPHARQAGCDVGEEVTPADRRLRYPVHTQDGVDHESQSALRADPQLVQGGSERGARAGSGRRVRAVRKDDPEPINHVFDVSEKARLLARRSSRDEATDAGARKRAWVVAQCQAPGVERFFELVAVDACLAVAEQVGFIDLENTVEASHVKDKLTCLWVQRATHPGGTTHRRDSDASSRRPLQDR